MSTKSPLTGHWLILKKDTLSLRAAFHSSIVRNIASLYAIRFADYIVPLIMVPYLVRVLGPAGYGVVAFGQGLINYLMLFVEYGFDLSATRKISAERNNLSAINHIALHVWAAKGGLSLTGFTALLAMIYLIPKLSEVSMLLVILYGLVLGNVLFPTWLFQGMEQMTAISLINLAMKLFVLIGVFALVRRPEDYLLYASLVSTGTVAAGLIGAAAGVRLFRLRLVRISLIGIVDVLKEGWILFLSKASVSLYTAGNAFILGMLTDNTAVGYYSAAEKLTKSVLGLLGPISQAAYPRFSKLASESKELMLLWGKRMLLLMGGAGCALGALIAGSAPFIVTTLLGSQYTSSIPVVRILAPTILLIALSNVLGIQIMLPLGEDRAFTLILFGAGALNVAGAIVLAPTWQALGMAIAVLISELCVTISMLAYLHVKGIPLLTKGRSVWHKGAF